MTGPVPRDSSEALLVEALEDLCYQFAYTTTLNGRPAIHTGGLSALEQAFRVLGWPDPHDAPGLVQCDEPGCHERVSCGTPTPGGYRQTCGAHRPREA